MPYLSPSASGVLPQASLRMSLPMLQGFIQTVALNILYRSSPPLFFFCSPLLFSWVHQPSAEREPVDPKQQRMAEELFAGLGLATGRGGGPSEAESARKARRPLGSKKSSEAPKHTSGRSAPPQEESGNLFFGLETAAAPSAPAAGASRGSSSEKQKPPPKKTDLLFELDFSASGPSHTPPPPPSSADPSLQLLFGLPLTSSPSPSPSPAPAPSRSLLLDDDEMLGPGAKTLSPLPPPLTQFL